MRFLLICFILTLLGTAAWADQQTTNYIFSGLNIDDLKAKSLTNDAAADFALGSIYRDGVMVKQDKAEAVKWFEKAAEHGNVGAQMMVGINYWLGLDVKLDEAKGIRWFERAAERGEPGAFHYLGAAYYLGKGVKQDYVQCLKWTLLFMETGSPLIPDDSASLKAQLADVESKLTPAQIEEGKRLAAETRARLKENGKWLGES